MAKSLAGRLLVATPHLLDPNFYRSVVLIFEHGDDGALGLVLNRPTDEKVVSHLPHWAEVVTPPAVVFVGGPVRNEIAVGVAEGPVALPEGWTPVVGAVGLVDLSIDPTALDGLARVRVFSGYSGWEQGQLESELETGSWFTLDAQPDDAFSREPDQLWNLVLRRQHSNVSLYADYPADVSLN